MNLCHVWSESRANRISSMGAVIRLSCMVKAERKEEERVCVCVEEVGLWWGSKGNRSRDRSLFPHQLYLYSGIYGVRSTVGSIILRSIYLHSELCTLQFHFFSWIQMASCQPSTPSILVPTTRPGQEILVSWHTNQAIPRRHLIQHSGFWNVSVLFLRA